MCSDWRSAEEPDLIQAASELISNHGPKKLDGVGRVTGGKVFFIPCRADGRSSGPWDRFSVKQKQNAGGSVSIAVSGGVEVRRTDGVVWLADDCLPAQVSYSSTPGLLPTQPPDDALGEVSRL